DLLDQKPLYVRGFSVEVLGGIRRRRAMQACDLACGASVDVGHADLLSLVISCDCSLVRACVVRQRSLLLRPAGRGCASTRGQTLVWSKLKTGSRSSRKESDTTSGSMQSSTH